MDENKPKELESRFVKVGEGCVLLTLDVVYELRFGHKVIKKFSALTGCAMDGIEDALGYYDNVSLALGLMLHEVDPSITPENVDDFIDDAERRLGLRPMDVILAVMQAAAKAFGGDKNKGAAEPQEGSESPLSETAGAGEKACDWPKDSAFRFPSGNE